MKGALYVCATPIGNLEDASRRLVRVLSEVDLIAAEDTRRTRKLLSHFGIHRPLTSYHEQNEVKQAGYLAGRIEAGLKVALVSDGGMPAISDPGYRLVAACIGRALPVEVIPGPSAILPALVLSGLATARFAFEGFLPRKAGERRRRLEAIADDPRTLVFFEAPGRVAATLSGIREVMGNRKMALVRELTKVHEQVVRATVAEVLAGLPPELLGEVVLVVEGAVQSEQDLLSRAVGQARRAEAAGLPKSKAAAEAASAFGVPKASVYEQLLSRN